MTRREKRRRERELKRLGYRPLSTAEQVTYIIIYNKGQAPPTPPPLEVMEETENGLLLLLLVV